MSKRSRKPNKEVCVLLALIDNPRLTDAQVAEIAGCYRTSLYRMPRFRMIRAIQKAERRESLPRGQRTSGTDGPRSGSSLEAWDRPRREEEDG